MNKVARFLKLSAADRRLIVEASILLLAARAALKLLPFRWIARVVSRAPAASSLENEAAEALVRRVRWAVDRSARHGIGTAICFPQGIAAQMMLARRGLSSTLHYGVTKSPGGAVEAHVWVRAGAMPVVGCETAEQFTLLVSFPRMAAGATPSR
jgi:hypothetical protein